jgi:hypothetical protein
MQFARLENRLQHRERIERADGQRNAYQSCLSITARRLSALAQKSNQRLGRGVLRRVDGKDGHATTPVES